MSPPSGALMALGSSPSSKTHTPDPLRLPFDKWDGAPWVAKTTLCSRFCETDHWGEALFKNVSCGYCLGAPSRPHIHNNGIVSGPCDASRLHKYQPLPLLQKLIPSIMRNFVLPHIAWLVQFAFPVCSLMVLDRLYIHHLIDLWCLPVVRLLLQRIWNLIKPGAMFSLY